MSPVHRTAGEAWGGGPRHRLEIDRRGLLTAARAQEVLYILIPLEHRTVALLMTGEKAVEGHDDGQAQRQRLR